MEISSFKNKLLQTMRDVLNCPMFTDTDDFFEFGGSSLGAYIILAKMDHPDLNIPLIYKERTVNKIVEKIINLKIDNTIDIIKIAKEEGFPLLPFQEIFFKYMLEDDSSHALHLPFIFHFKKEISKERIKNVIETIFNNHPIFKMSYQILEDGKIRQYLTDKKVVIEDVKFSNKKDLITDFNIDKLYSLKMYEYNGSINLFVDFHNCLVDGTSLVCLFNDLNRIMNSLPLSKDNILKYLYDLKSSKLTGTIKSDNAYFDNLIKKCNNYVTNYPYEANKSVCFENTLQLSLGTHESFNNLMNNLKTKDTIFILALVILSLLKENNCDKALVCNSTNGRLYSGNEIGCFLVEYLVLFENKNNATLLDLLHSIETQLDEGYKHSLFQQQNNNEYLSLDCITIYNQDDVYSHFQENECFTIERLSNLVGNESYNDFFYYTKNGESILEFVFSCNFNKNSMEKVMININDIFLKIVKTENKNNLLICDIVKKR